MFSSRGVLLLGCLLISPAAFADTGEGTSAASYGLDWGLIVEKGQSEARVTPWLGALLELGWPQNDGTWVLSTGVRSGALLGSVASVSLEGLWQAGRPDSEGWAPSWGLSAEVDAGDALIFGESVFQLPPVVQVYWGLSLRPLAFRAGNWSWSFFDLSVSTPRIDALHWRAWVAPLTLLWNSTPTTGVPRAPLTLDVSASVSPALLGNYMMPSQGLVAPRVAVRTGIFEAALGWSPQLTAVGPYEGAQWSGELLLSPSGSWQPALGLGVLYSWFVFWSPIFDPDELSLYLVARPLQWAFAVNENLALSVSGLELRLGPVLPTPVVGFYDQGSLVLQCTLLRVGLQYSPVGGVQ